MKSKNLLKTRLSPEFWVSTLVLLSFLSGFVVWTQTKAFAANDDFGGFTYHKKLSKKKPVRR